METARLKKRIFKNKQNQNILESIQTIYQESQADPDLQPITRAKSKRSTTPSYICNRSHSTI